MRSSQCLGYTMVLSLAIMLTIAGIAIHCWRADHQSPVTQAQVDALDNSGASPAPQYPGDRLPLGGIAPYAVYASQDIASLITDGCVENKAITVTCRLICIDGKLIIEGVGP